MFARAYVDNWSKMPMVHQRLEAFGIPQSDVPVLLNAFADAVRSGNILTADGTEKFSLRRFSDIFPSGKRSIYIDRIFTSIFFTWASEPSIQSSLEAIVPASTVFRIQKLQKAADLTYPADLYANARKMRRKIIMHVGPTNSGKTHNALRALASANCGLYAGPLRLLAHEVWERLNKGQIVPLHAKPESGTTAIENTGLDVPDESESAAPIVRMEGNPKYARPCNLVTGEERRIVEEEASLLSATVEMVPFNSEFDVAVVDEIQMLADPERGGAWTAAVLGLCAKELHLCGEETAVPVVEDMLKDTGDEIVVHRYERLTPLVVENESLGGDFRLVRRGDCIVSFSRASIFELKRRVEATTGLRCAVAYGRLPPEVRSEQAALFNDPNSDYDVMVGSDAIGMGLNLQVSLSISLNLLTNLISYQENQTYYLRSYLEMGWPN
jgi:ATP-dependent RNA helicase SUPV3L1/SUV3